MSSKGVTKRCYYRKRRLGPVCHYIHLNPVRAGLVAAGGARKKAVESEASEIGSYQWERHLSELLQSLDKGQEDLQSDRKGSNWKVALAIYLRQQHLVPHQWLADNLKMGKPSSKSNRLGSLGLRVSLPVRIDDC